MNNYTSNLKNPKSVLFVMLVLLLVVGSFAAYAYAQQSKNDTVAIRTIKLSTLHPKYDSVDELIAAENATFVGRGVVLDNGTVRSKVVSRTPGAPPEVSTDYKLDVQSVVKGDDTLSEITVSLLGGTVKNERYAYESFIPELKKGDIVIVFALLGDDGKYYPLAGSTAIAVQKEDGSFSLGEDTLTTTDAVTFTEQSLTRQ